MYLKRAPEIQTKLLPDGHIVLTSSKTDWAHTLNPAGALVWEFCDGKYTRDEINLLVSRIIQPAGPSKFNREIADLLTELIELGLLIDLDKKSATANDNCSNSLV